MPYATETMNDAAKHAIARALRFIQDYGVESATGYFEWQFWVSVPNAHEEAESEALGGAWAPGLQHALTIRAGDLTGTHCVQLWVTESIYQQACDLIDWMVPDGTVMGSRSGDDGYRRAIHGPIRTLEEAEDLMETAAELIAAREAQAAAAELAEAQAELAAAADEVADLEEPGEEDETVESALAQVIASLPPEIRASLPEAGATWRQVGEALRRAGRPIGEDATG